MKKLNFDCFDKFRRRELNSSSIGYPPILYTLSHEFYYSIENEKWNINGEMFDQINEKDYLFFTNGKNSKKKN